MMSLAFKGVYILHNFASRVLPSSPLNYPLNLERLEDTMTSSNANDGAHDIYDSST
jgi:hypothetical protein